MKYPKSRLVTMLLISFFGSLPPGIINLRISTYLLNNRLAEAMAFSSGAALSEMLLVASLILIKGRLTPGCDHRNNIHLAGGILLVFATTFSILAANRPLPAQFNEAAIAIPGLSGFMMNLFNPFQLPFWIAWILVLSPQSTKQHTGIVKALIEGALAALGTLLALGLYGSAAHLLSSVFPGSIQTFRTLCGFALGTVVILQLYKVVTAYQKSNAL